MTTATQQIAPLEAGDFLTRAEFLQRWQVHPEISRAELIGGVVHMPSPVSLPHGEMENNLATWLGVYKAYTPGCKAGNNTTTFLGEELPQPDVFLRILESHGGSSWEENQFLHGSPELLTEVCGSSASYDLHVKLDLYQGAGVAEYLAVLLYEREIRWHRLQGGVYQPLLANQDGLWQSQVFPGLWLDGNALFEGNMNQVLAKLQEGIQSSEHRAFVDKLGRNKK
jgi:Uma2 family endonuclease